MSRDVTNKILKLLIALLFCMTAISIYCNIRDNSYEKYEDGIDEITYSLELTRDGQGEAKKESETFIHNKTASWKNQ